MRVVKFKAYHLSTLTEGPLGWVRNYAGEAELRALEADPHTYTAVTEEGEVIACGGITKYWEGRGEVWAVVSHKARPHFVALHSAAKRFVNAFGFRRLEAAVDVDFKMGHRWVKALGFKQEAPCLRAYLPNGKDCSLYARVA